ncbi:MAG: acyl-CoA dehydrogenase family protein [Solirubrobacteraceae bacterium]|jgi:alkylation response protein AidB-like acyl-CoA dehydrogenase|nr:acyl-CoA dehydrogenase family protein [Solirubrobacteraceae bacterium]
MSAPLEPPPAVAATLAELDAFIEAQIRPLELAGDNARFFDHRREWARTDVERGGVPSREWDELLAEMRRRADAAGWLRRGLPEHLGGSGATHLEMAFIREHLARRGVGLHDDALYESSVVGNFPVVVMFDAVASDAQRAEWIEPMITGELPVGFALTEPGVGSDATRMATTAVPDGDDWVISGRKRWNSAAHAVSHNVVFARTSGAPGEPLGITAFLVPTDAPGYAVDFFWWTMNLPADAAEVTLTGVRVPASAVLGEVGAGLVAIQTFVHDQRMRQAAQSVGAARYCIDLAVAYARDRQTWERPLAARQAIQFPLAELHTEAEMVRALLHAVAARLDEQPATSVSDLVAMCNYRANRLACEAADQAMQVCGGVGYSRHLPFEHIYRRHRRYRITEGAEEIQIRKVAHALFRDAERGAAALAALWPRDRPAWPEP